jgi:hypothetical protein
VQIPGDPERILSVHGGGPAQIRGSSRTELVPIEDGPELVGGVVAGNAEEVVLFDRRVDLDHTIHREGRTVDSKVLAQEPDLAVRDPARRIGIAGASARRLLRALSHPGSFPGVGVRHLPGVEDRGG